MAEPAPCTATGCAALYLPPGPERDEILGLIRIGVQFQAQHVGRRPGFLRKYICGVVAGLPPPVRFADLLVELELAAARRNAGDDREPVERVSRSFAILKYHEPGRAGEAREISFGTLRNIFTAAKRGAIHESR